MRLSVIKTDPGYSPKAFIPSLKVTFNDVEQNACVITADEEQGLIVRYVKNEKGELVHTNGVAHTETVTGKVRITFDPE